MKLLSIAIVAEAALRSPQVPPQVAPAVPAIPPQPPVQPGYTAPAVPAIPPQPPVHHGYPAPGGGFPAPVAGAPPVVPVQPATQPGLQPPPTPTAGFGFPVQATPNNPASEAKNPPPEVTEPLAQPQPNVLWVPHPPLAPALHIVSSSKISDAPISSHKDKKEDKTTELRAVTSTKVDDKQEPEAKEEAKADEPTVDSKVQALKKELEDAKNPPAEPEKKDESAPEPAPDAGDLPSQGFEGSPVHHENMETTTQDWRKEYGKEDNPSMKASNAATLLVIPLLSFLF